jgi:taurine dioxygenase
LITLFEIQQETAALGATILGIDLTKNLSDKEVNLINEALAVHQVIFFRDQELTSTDHKRLALKFGNLQTHPAYPTVEHYPEITILENDRENPSKIEEWHTDMTFKSHPPLGSILIGKIIPKTGGDTLFSSLASAYDDLSNDMKASLEGLTAEHSFEHGFKESLAEPGGKERLADALKDNPPVDHPVVRTHPITKRKLLYVNRLFTYKINGLEKQESQEMLEYLCNHIQKDKYVCRFVWEKNSIAFWDNRSVLHKPDNTYWPQLRRMERITIDDSTRPY